LSPKISDYPARRRIRTATLAAEAVEGLTQVDQKQWEEARHRIEELGVSDADEAERILKESFGWSGQAFWNGEKVSMFVLLLTYDACLNYDAPLQLYIMAAVMQHNSVANIDHTL
jgi:hypothetical protein